MPNFSSLAVCCVVLRLGFWQFDYVKLIGLSWSDQEDHIKLIQSSCLDQVNLNQVDRIKLTVDKAHTELEWVLKLKLMLTHPPTELELELGLSLATSWDWAWAGLSLNQSLDFFSFDDAFQFLLLLLLLHSFKISNIFYWYHLVSQNTWSKVHLVIFCFLIIC